ncbi:MAG: hypothetical protein JJ974_01170 [Phycisphaerales bacterium]|nr:hypothetical protein [Phycisphaerales bacterium]
MKRTPLILTLLACTPILSGCAISKSFSIHKDWSCGCHGPHHHHHCYYKSKHRGKHTGSHAPDHPDSDRYIAVHQASAGSLARLNHETTTNRPVTARSRVRPLQKETVRPNAKKSNTKVLKRAKSKTKRSPRS